MEKLDVKDPRDPLGCLVSRVLVDQEDLKVEEVHLEPLECQDLKDKRVELELMDEEEVEYDEDEHDEDEDDAIMPAGEGKLSLRVRCGGTLTVTRELSGVSPDTHESWGKRMRFAEEAVNAGLEVLKPYDAEEEEDIGAPAF